MTMGDGKRCMRLWIQGVTEVLEASGGLSFRENLS